VLVIWLHRGTLRSNRTFAAEAARSPDPLPRTVLLRTYVAEGAETRARVLFEELVDGIDEIDEQPIFVNEHWEYAWPSSLCMLADACAALGDRERAAGLYERMRPRAGFHAIIGDYASAHLGGLDLRLGLLATLVERFDEAEAHLHAETSWAEREGARVWLAHGRLAEARLFARRDGPGDRARSERAAELALDLGREIGMQAVVAGAEALLGAE